MASRFQAGTIQVEIFDNKMALGAAAAIRVAGHIERAIATRGEARVIFATGASQYEFLEALRALDTVDWPKVTAFHLDEYLGMSIEHPASFRRYLNERLFDQVPVGAVHLLNGDTVDSIAECMRYSALLREKPIDIACIGIGENGHLAFNDPPADFETDKLVHVVNLDMACRQQQVGEGHFEALEAVPTQALSLSIPAILAAEMISCVAPDLRKAAAIQCALEGPLDPNCPASALRKHQQCHLLLDVHSASRLGR